MFIRPSSPPLNPTLFPSGTTTGGSLSARAYPFPDSLPLSTLLTPEPDQFPTPLLPCTSFSPGCRLPSPSEFSATMPPPGAVGYLNLLGIVNSLSQSGASDSSSLNLPGLNTDTSTDAGTSLPPSYPFSSNSGVSTSFTPWFTTSWTSSSTISLSSSLSLTLSTDSSLLEFTTTPTSIPPVPATSTTHTFSTSVSSSYYPSRSTSSPVSALSTPLSIQSSSAAPHTTVVVVSTTEVTSVGPLSSSPLASPSTSIYTIVSALPGQEGTVTDFITTSVVLSTQPPGRVSTSSAPLSSSAIAGIVLGIVGTIAFSALWLFCARRRHHELAQRATFIPPENHTPGPLDDEILDGGELGYDIRDTHSPGNTASRTGPVVEERSAGILAILHSLERFGGNGGSTGGVYGSRHDSAADVNGNDDVAQASSPTLPLHTIPPDDPPYVVPLSPPPPVLSPAYHQTTQPAPPPSAYHTRSRRISSPGPDAAAWLGGYSVAPSYTSHYAHSQTLGSGSGSGSGSVDALTRTRTGSEEPLLGIGKVVPDMFAGASTSGGASLTIATDLGGNKADLGSAFGSPAGSMYSPSAAHSAPQHDTSGSYDARTASGSGSYGYARSGTPSSFDVLRSVSSQGALSSAYSHGHSQGFRFGFSRPESSSSGSVEKKTIGSRPSFRVPPTSFKSRKDWGSVASDKAKQGEKQSLREKHWRRRSSGSVSISGSVEKQGRASPVAGVRAFLERLRRTGNTPSPHSSNRDLPSQTEASADVDPEKAAVRQVTPPPIQVHAATPRHRRFSFVLSNPDPHPPSPYSGADVVPSDASPRQYPRPIQQEMPTSDFHDPDLVSFNAEEVHSTIAPLVGYALVPVPSPAPTEESHLAEGLLHPRLQIQGYSGSSLRDFEDYSRPIGGVVKNQLYSTTTFGTQDDTEGRSPNQGTPVKNAIPGGGQEHDNEAGDVFGMPVLRGVSTDSWLIVDLPPTETAQHSPVEG